MFVKGAALLCSFTFTVGICLSPLPSRQGLSPPPSLLPVQKGTVCCLLKRDKAERAGLVGGRLGWGAGELEEPG